MTTDLLTPADIRQLQEQAAEIERLQTAARAALEAAARVVENGSFFHENAPDALLARSVATVIRTLAADSDWLAALVAGKP